MRSSAKGLVRGGVEKHEVGFGILWCPKTTKGINDPL